MALVKCGECSAQISDSAKTCPQCGAKQVKKVGLAGWIVVAIVVGAVYRVVTTTGTAPPVQISEAQKKTERDFQTVVAGARWLKQNSKNPASFQLETAMMVDGKTICYEYRGTNSFNAIVPGRYVITDTVSSGKDADWAKHCAGKTGVNFTHARQAL